MVSKLLVAFHRDNNIEKADLGEKVGNFGLGLMRIGFGKTVVVKGDNPDFDKVVHSTILRVAAVALFIFTLPISGTIAVIGCIGYAFSESHDKIFNSYGVFKNQNSHQKTDDHIVQADRDSDVNPDVGIIVSDSVNENILDNSDHNPNENDLIIEESEGVDNGDNQDLPNKVITSNSMSENVVNDVNPIEEDLIVQEKQDSDEAPNLGPQERRIPPLSMIDTQIVVDGKFTSEHGSVDFFTDDEILENLNIIKTVIQEDTEIRYTKNGKAILQQQATRGCTAATAAMLILDNGKEPDYWGLRMRTLANDEDLVKDIEKAGLKAFINKASDLSELKSMITRHDSCVGSVKGGHVIVMDEVSSDLSKIRLRDPYHGWEITVGSEAFLKKWVPGNIIQIEK